MPAQARPVDPAPVAADADRPTAIALRTTELAKAFGPTQALRSCSFELRRGEVHCVVGENGSGKTTLVKILAGVHRPDAGTLELGGRDRRRTSALRGAPRRPASPPSSRRSSSSNRARCWRTSGWDPTACSPAVSPRQRSAGGRSRYSTSSSASRRRSTRRRSGCPSASGRRAASPARSCATRASSSSTRRRRRSTSPRATACSSSCAARAEAGAAVIFISHRMDEIEEIGDRCTVMRSGETVATLERRSATADELVRLMTGSDHLTAEAAKRPHRPAAEVVLARPGARAARGRARRPRRARGSRPGRLPALARRPRGRRLRPARAPRRVALRVQVGPRELRHRDAGARPAAAGCCRTHARARACRSTSTA